MAVGLLNVMLSKVAPVADAVTVVMPAVPLSSTSTTFVPVPTCRASTLMTTVLSDDVTVTGSSPVKLMV